MGAPCLTFVADSTITFNKYKMIQGSKNSISGWKCAPDQGGRLAQRIGVIVMVKLLCRYFQAASAFRAAVLIFILILSWGGGTISGVNSAAAQGWQKTADKRVIRQRIRDAIAAQNRHSQRWLRNPDVVGTGTGLGADGRPVIRIFSRSVGLAGIPYEVDGVPVQEKLTGIFIAYNDPRDWFERPVPIGVSSGHPDITAGTIGARVKDSLGNVYALSNNHVYANQNEGLLGDSILQPGRIDGGIDPIDKIGELFQFKLINFGLFGSNRIDAAIAATTIDELGRSTLPAGYGMPSVIIFGDRDSDGVFDDKADLLGLAVQKFGRTTGLTHGQITEINVTISVCYANCFDSSGMKLARFTDQIRVVGNDDEAFSAGGDSGSLIITDDPRKNPVALLFAGSSTSTLANRIDLVLDSFDVSVDGASIEEICESDFDRDGDVDGSDFNVFRELFPLDMAADLNDDGLLTDADLQEMADDFGQNNCP